MTEPNSLETLITLLCLNCPKRDTVCRDNRPSWIDAYRCKWNEADELGLLVDAEFRRLNGQHE